MTASATMKSLAFSPFAPPVFRFNQWKRSHRREMFADCLDAIDGRGGVEDPRELIRSSTSTSRSSAALRARMERDALLIE